MRDYQDPGQQIEDVIKKKKILEYNRMVEMTEKGTAKGNNFKGNLNWKIDHFCSQTHEGQAQAQ